jgi:hypothetical protein
MIAALLMALLAEPPIVFERCDLIELNVVYCGETGRESFRQLIFWEEIWPDARLHVREWRIVRNPSQYPLKNGVEWRAVVVEDEKITVIRAPTYRETWTTFDPELAERDVLPDNRRKKLRKE